MNKFVLFAFLLFTAKKQNKFFRLFIFFGESMARKSAYGFIWPLGSYFLIYILWKKVRKYLKIMHMIWIMMIHQDGTEKNMKNSMECMKKAEDICYGILDGIFEEFHCHLHMYTMSYCKSLVSLITVSNKIKFNHIVHGRLYRWTKNSFPFF